MIFVSTFIAAFEHQRHKETDEQNQRHQQAGNVVIRGDLELFSGLVERWGESAEPAVAGPADAQRTATDYHRAEQFLGTNARAMVTGDQVVPTWLEDGRFWYPSRVSGGTEFRVVDPDAGTRVPAFDHVRLAAGLSAAAESFLDAGWNVRVLARSVPAWATT